MPALAAIDHRHLDLVRQNGEVLASDRTSRLALSGARSRMRAHSAASLRNFSICV
jgi:hypothetical protein